jgi:hypothetical protein
VHTREVGVRRIYASVDGYPEQWYETKNIREPQEGCVALVRSYRQFGEPVNWTKMKVETVEEDEDKQKTYSLKTLDS